MPMSLYVQTSSTNIRGVVDFVEMGGDIYMIAGTGATQGGQLLKAAAPTYVQLVNAFGTDLKVMAAFAGGIYAGYQFVGTGITPASDIKLFDGISAWLSVGGLAPSSNIKSFGELGGTLYFSGAPNATNIGSIYQVGGSLVLNSTFPEFKGAFVSFNGNLYMVATNNGNIYQVTPGACTLVVTSAPAHIGVSQYPVCAFNGALYYLTSTNLYTWDGIAANWTLVSAIPGAGSGACLGVHQGNLYVISFTFFTNIRFLRLVGNSLQVVEDIPGTYSQTPSVLKSIGGNLLFNMTQSNNAGLYAYTDPSAGGIFPGL